MSLPADHERPSRLKTALANLLWRITPTCEDVVRLISSQQDRALPALTRFRLGLHLRVCKWCVRYARQLRVLHNAMEHFEDHFEQVDHGLSADQKARLKRALGAQIRSNS